MTDKKKPTYGDVWKEYERGLGFNARLNLNETVEANENFFIGRQWEGVDAGGLPTPVFNFLKRVVLFTIAGVTSENLKMNATALNTTGDADRVRQATDIVNNEFESLFEANRIVNLIREYMRNAAVDGDGCLYTYWDPDVETGQPAKGAIVTEVIENTRVFFGNPNDRRVQRQPHIIISSRQLIDSVKDRAKENGVRDIDAITTDTDDKTGSGTTLTDDKATVLLRLWRNKETGTIWGIECVRNSIIRPAWDTGLKLYPVTWLNWDYVQDNYHGQAMITGLIPNQIFINKLFAMSMISLMTTAYPKIVYDKTRVARWDNRVGAAIPIAGGDVSTVAKIIDPAQISPQIAQFIQLAVEMTQTFLGATNAALGEVRPDNTSAIIALQRASAAPNEITKQNLYQSIEELGRIYVDFMSGYYGTRTVAMKAPDKMAEVMRFAGVPADEQISMEYDFSQLSDMQMNIKLDVGASAYWSEIASMQTLDNLIMQGKIGLDDYLERVPEGYITKRHELLNKVRQAQPAPAPSGGGAPQTGETPIPETQGYSALQRQINNAGQA